MIRWSDHEMQHVSEKRYREIAAELLEHAIQTIEYEGLGDIRVSVQKSALRLLTIAGQERFSPGRHNRLLAIVKDLKK